MKRAILMAGLVCGFGVASAHAGPCTSEITKIENAVNQPNSQYVPMARQTVGAQMDRQPTPASIEAAQKRANAHYQEVLSQAKSQDNANNSACQETVKDLKDLVGMQ
jgi:hypothetical protein